VTRYVRNIRAMFHEVLELERFHTAKVIFKVIQGHWQWCHSTNGTIANALE